MFNFKHFLVYSGLNLLLLHHQPRSWFFSSGQKYLEVWVPGSVDTWKCTKLCWPSPASFVAKVDRNVHRAIYLSKISLRCKQLDYKASWYMHKWPQRNDVSWKHSESALSDYSEVQPTEHQPSNHQTTAYQRSTSTSPEKHRDTTVSKKTQIRDSKTLSQDHPRKPSAPMFRSETQWERSVPEHLLDSEELLPEGLTK